ncbi:MAG TPA: hypothetical protein VGD73_29985 [Pseudonocardia sp.]|uniref:hypothetical protein n=1 Tax=Pseudonocardia sp. TaxID=60912 RepID=UPI002ED7C692
MIEQNPLKQSRSRRWRWCAALTVGLVALLVLAGCGGGAGETAPRPPAASGPAGAANPPAHANCAQRATDLASFQRASASASPGNTVCVSGDLSGERLEITRGGSEQAPITFLGDGKTVTSGINVSADNVVVDGFVAQEPEAPGVALQGSNITLRNTTINSPREGDGDGIRFWGNNIKILHNTITDTSNDTGAHADCMQTYATDENNPASQDVLIDSNRCERIDNNCLIAEGPNSSAGDGSGEGETKNITFSNNFCDNRAAQAVLADDVRNMMITGNQIVGQINHAFAFQNESTSGVVSNNQVRSVKYEVGMDSSSEQGYRGPGAGGAP